MTEVFYQPRKSGKTTKLVKMASELNAITIVKSADRAKEVSFIAKRMGLAIPKPIVLNRPLKGSVQAMTITDFSKTIDYDKIGSYL